MANLRQPPPFTLLPFSSCYAAAQKMEAQQEPRGRVDILHFTDPVIGRRHLPPYVRHSRWMNMHVDQASDIPRRRNQPRRV